MAIKTLLLCFIHGFKGDEETFYQFPEDLKTSISIANPTLKIETRVYPKYETRGDLALSVETFKEWLQAQVITLEIASSNVQSAIHDPSVCVILVAHSMGGFVAAETLFSVLDNRPVSNDPDVKLTFPLIQGVLAFDTPWNGLSRSMFAYGAFGQYQNLSSAWNLLSSGTSFLTSAAGAKTLTSNAAQNTARNQVARETASSAANNNSWTRWSALAARTGTYGAIMAGGVAAYIHRDQIIQSLRGINRENLSKVNYTTTKSALANIDYTSSISQGLTHVSRESIGEGFTWMASHLKFVGALMKTESLKIRLERLSEIEGVGVKCLYTSLGENGVWSGGYFVPKRTFCAIPTISTIVKEKRREKSEKMRGLFVECPDVKAGNEILAHCGMFRKERNENYGDMVKLSTGLVGEWLLIDPRRVRDEWKPSGEQLKRTLSESQVWDDDGKVLKPPGGEGDEGQLDAILKCDEMPHGEDGGVDEKELMDRAAGVPLPVDEDVIGEGVLGEGIQGAESAVKAIEAAGPDKCTASEQEIKTVNIHQELMGDQSKDWREPSLVEDEKSVQVDANNLAEKTTGGPLNRKSNVFEDSQDAESKQDQQVQRDPEKKTWIGMISGMTSSTTKKNPTPDPDSQKKDDNKLETNSTSSKTWIGILPSVSSLSIKKQESRKEGEVESGLKSGEAAEQSAGEMKKKWFGVA